MVQEQMSKIDFQDSGCVVINTILAILYLFVDLLLHHKVRLHSQIFKMAAVAAVLDFRSAQF